MAATYRPRLQKEGKLTGSAGSTLPVMVNLVGAIDDKAPVLGIPREILRPLTTFSQAGDIADRLAEAFGGDRLVIRYSGWRKGGLKSSVLTGFDPEGKLGGAKGLGTLADKLQGMNARLFPDADFQYVYRDKLFDGFSSSKDVVRFITSESAYKPAYNKATFVPDADEMCIRDSGDAAALYEHGRWADQQPGGGTRRVGCYHPSKPGAIRQHGGVRRRVLRAGLRPVPAVPGGGEKESVPAGIRHHRRGGRHAGRCLLYTSCAAARAPSRARWCAG